jgi:S-adenosyl-L-methionine hydrolase (adenosine-forming)
MAPPVIALLTDFGLRDHYVGVMKGVMLGICPEATFVDITHDIPPQDVAATVFELDASRRYFPERTIFLVVVDPGVGSARRGLAIECNGQLFVGPDNGVFTSLASDEEPWRGVELTNPRYRRSEVSRTFEGRDRFAPAAAWLARGVEVTELGSPIASIVRVALPDAHRHGAIVDGRVQRVDRFGNLITTVTTAHLAGFERAHVEFADDIVDIVGTYAEAAPGTLCALFGSSGFLEIAVNGGNAATALAARVGDPVRLRQGA